MPTVLNPGDQVQATCSRGRKRSGALLLQLSGNAQAAALRCSPRPGCRRSLGEKAA